jgi:hypothetical protein
MAVWPDVEQLKDNLSLSSPDNTTKWDDQLEVLLAAAIAQVQIDVGEPVDEPDDSLAHAALVLAISLGSTEGEPDVSAAARLPKYQRLLKGHRVRFGIA